MASRGNRRRPVYGQPKSANKAAAAADRPADDDKRIGNAIRKLEEAINIFHKHLKTSDEREESRYPLKRKLEILTFVVIAGYTLLTLALFIVSVYQAYVAHETMISDGRAWLYPENFAFQQIIAGSGDIDFNVVGDSENVGKEPAMGVLFNHPDAGLIKVSGTNPEYFNIPTSDMCEGSSNWGSHTQAAGTVFPDEKWSYERTVEISELPAPQADVANIMAGTEIIYLRDCAAYETYNHVHTSAFCFYDMFDMVTKMMKTFHCPLGNEAD